MSIKLFDADMLLLVVLVFGIVGALPGEKPKSGWPASLANDIIFTEHQKLIRQMAPNMSQKLFVIEGEQYRWPGNTIPYAFSDQHSSDDRQKIRQGMDAIERVTCFRFVPRQEQQDYVLFEPRQGCFSYFGRIGGEQILSLDQNCFDDYVIIHELIHSIGVEHEHQRSDRNLHVDVHLDNVESGKEFNFEMRPWRLYSTYDIRFIQ
ncbi:Metalloendopeptidase [Aphelenchoides bicaudatus]|nr:Metalloendopeptidase [Aphelenchoides bicaudatus]